MNFLEVNSLSAWHEWLVENHQQVSEVWLVYHKHNPGLRYEESVEEALCFGWVDNLIKRIDSERYARKFTPRKTGSRWSEFNIARAQRMIEQGRMMEAGLRMFEETKNRVDEGLSRREQMETWRQELLGRLDARTLILFTQLPPSHQRQYAGWVMSGKKEETRQKRQEELSEVLGRGERLGLK